MSYSFPPEQAWAPLPAAAWDAAAARHLLGRVGWTATPNEIERAMADGLSRTIARLYAPSLPQLPKPASIVRLEETTPALQLQIKGETGPERRSLERELRDRERFALQELSLRWLEYAAEPQVSAYAKWILCLSDVYVVSAEKVRRAPLIFRHLDVIARHALGQAPTLTKAISRSPAMVLYLDLNQSQRRAPNENFARELFELFVLGEGNYSEPDIKQAARAFTGYRIAPESGEFRFAPRQHDDREKTIFGRTGRFNGDDVIDLAYAQPAAARFLPHEMVKFYLSDSPLPSEYLATLGGEWKRHSYDLSWLLQQFFSSQLFFAPEFRGNFIKSPIQFHLGLIQDLGLSLTPLARMTLNPLRQMGQWLFFPPNVRGWVGGRNWINSATLIARRHAVESVFAPINEETLNADEVIELEQARATGAGDFTVTDESLAQLTKLTDHDLATTIVRRYLLPVPNDEIARLLEHFITGANDDPKRRIHAIRRAVATILQSPQYQLC